MESQIGANNIYREGIVCLGKRVGKHVTVTAVLSGENVSIKANVSREKRGGVKENFSSRERVCNCLRV